MPSISCCNSSPNEEIGSNCESTPQKRRLRSNSTSLQGTLICTPNQQKSPRSCFNSGPSTPLKGKNGDFDERLKSRCQLPVMKLPNDFTIKPDWQPNDVEHLGAVKAALHVSIAPSIVLCHENEQKKVFDFCKNCIEKGKAGSLYLCGLPGSGKSLSMEKVKQQLLNWSKDVHWVVNRPLHFISKMIQADDMFLGVVVEIFIHYTGAWVMQLPSSTHSFFIRFALTQYF